MIRWQPGGEDAMAYQALLDRIRVEKLSAEQLREIRKMANALVFAMAGAQDEKLAFLQGQYEQLISAVIQVLIDRRFTVDEKPLSER